MVLRLERAWRVRGAVVLRPDWMRSSILATVVLALAQRDALAWAGAEAVAGEREREPVERKSGRSGRALGPSGSAGSWAPSRPAAGAAPAAPAGSANRRRRPAPAR